MGTLASFALYSAATSVAALLTALAALVRHRLRFRNLPGPPHSMVWGHLKIVKETSDKFPPGTYAQVLFTDIKKSYDLPDIWYLDLWPVQSCNIVASSPEAAALGTTVSAWPQAKVVAKFFSGLPGAKMMEALNGHLWKFAHARIVPSLTPASVKAYTADIVEQSLVQRDRLLNLADLGEAVGLSRQMAKMPFAVVGKAVFGRPVDPDFNDKVLFDNTLDMINYYYDYKILSWNPWTRWRLRQKIRSHEAPLDDIYRHIISERLVALEKQMPVPSRGGSTSVLDRMLGDLVREGAKPSLEQLTVINDNIWGLFVAGSNTTADTLTYVLILLTTHPEILQKVRDEHDEVFHPQFDRTVQLLRQSPDKISQLVFTRAVILESLRLFPIGMTARDFPPGATTFTYKGQVLPTLGDSLWLILTHAIHYNPKIHSRPDEFLPERFLREDSERHSFRPFERGLRSCPGQMLAMQEMLIWLLVFVRTFDLDLLELQPREPRLEWLGIEKQVGHYAFQSMRVTAGPPGEVNVKFRARG